MRDLIKEVLREERNYIPIIKRNEELIPKILPTIVRFIKAKYGNDVRVKTSSNRVYHGTDNYTAETKHIDVFVLNENLVAAETKYQIWNYIKNVFGVDMGLYGACLSLDVYRLNWEKV